MPVTKQQFSDNKQREEWKKTKGMIVFSFVKRRPPFDLIDMFVDEPIKFAGLYKSKKDVCVDGIKIPIIAIEHLVKLKKKAGRNKDLDDIVQLNVIKRMQKG